MIEKMRTKIYHIWNRIPADRRFLVMILIGGCIFLTITKSWYIYTEPLKAGGRMLLTRMDVEIPEFLEARKEDGLLAKGETDTDWKQENGAGETVADVSGSDVSGSDVGNPDGSHPGQQVTQVPVTPETTPEPNPVPNTEPTSVPNTEPIPGTEIVPNPEPIPEPEPEQIVFQCVEDDYFADAVFIGDSRTVGMYEYSNLRDISTFYASVGLSVHKLFTAKIVEVPGQSGKITIEQALSENQYEKVYFMMGINEMGTGTVESFLEKYEECVNHIRELQPDAIIYLQGIMQVTTKRSAQGDYITNEGIAVRNEGIKALADDETIFYLEINEALCDEDGGLRAEYTHDGVHLKAQYIDIWKDYLKNHAVVMESE